MYLDSNMMRTFINEKDSADIHEEMLDNTAGISFYAVSEGVNRDRAARRIQKMARVRVFGSI